MRTFLSVILALTVFPITAFAQLYLIDKSCSLSGPDPDTAGIKVSDGSKGISECKAGEKKSNKVVCTYTPEGKTPKKTTTILKVLHATEDTLVLVNDVGNVQVVINGKKKSFTWGQTNTLAEAGIVITKLCVGYALDEKEVKQALKEDSK